MNEEQVREIASDAAATIMEFLCRRHTQFPSTHIAELVTELWIEDKITEAFAAKLVSENSCTCECCGGVFSATTPDAIRCNQCTVSCYKPKGLNVWIRGKHCPSNIEASQ